MSIVARSIGAFGRRDFWTFRTVHALAGAAITILGAGEALFVNESIKEEIAGIDSGMAVTSDRLAAIDRALFQFRMAQSNALVMGVLSANDALKPEFRQNVVELMFVTRKLPTEMMLQQIHPDDPAAFEADRKVYADLIAKAKKPESQADWNAVNTFEFETEGKLFEIEQRLLNFRDQLADARQKANGRLEFAVVLGFALQQIGFVTVLLAGLLYQHRQRPDAPA